MVRKRRHVFAKLCRCVRASRALYADARGESLLETLVSVVLIGVLVVPFVTVIRNASSWLSTDVHTEQAFAYARQGEDYVRTQANIAGNGNPPVVSAQTLSPTNGVTYTESITGPTSPSWDATGKLHMWTVTVSWKQANSGATHTVSLQLVVDPGAAS